jgi:hypothetical protein
MVEEVSPYLDRCAVINRELRVSRCSLYDVTPTHILLLC